MEDDTERTGKNRRPPSHICASYPVDSFREVIRRLVIKIKPELNMGRTPRTDRHRAQALPKPKIESKDEIEQLREENRQLRELVRTWLS